MGMARFLANAYEVRWKCLEETNGLYEQLALASADLGHRLYEIRDAKKGLGTLRVACDSMKNRYKFFSRGKALHCPSQL